MIPLVVLVASFLAFLGLGAAGIQLFAGWQPSLRFALAVMFLLGASAHFTRIRTDLVRMVPPSLPYPAAIVTITGGLEIGGAIGLVFPATARPAALGLIALLIAMFPANIHAARAGLTLAGKPVMPLPQRFAMQVVFLAAVVAAGWGTRGPF